MTSGTLLMICHDRLALIQGSVSHLNDNIKQNSYQIEVAGKPTEETKESIQLTVKTVVSTHILV